MPDAGERDASKRVDMSKGLVLINVVVLGRQPLINTYFFITFCSVLIVVI